MSPLAAVQPGGAAVVADVFVPHPCLIYPLLSDVSTGSHYSQLWQQNPFDIPFRWAGGLNNAPVILGSEYGDP